MFSAPNPEESENPHKNWKLSTNNPSLRLYVRLEIDHKNTQTQTRPSTSPLNPRHRRGSQRQGPELVRNAHVSVTPGLLSQLVKALGRGKMFGKCGKLREALDLFNEMKNQGSGPRGVRLQPAHVRNGEGWYGVPKRAVEMFEATKQPGGCKNDENEERDER
ncbi:hypothetical protein Bca4012_090602 [Brassica carinata]